MDISSLLLYYKDGKIRPFYWEQISSMLPPYGKLVALKDYKEKYHLGSRRRIDDKEVFCSQDMDIIPHITHWAFLK